jgi:hypothetical protein
MIRPGSCVSIRWQGQLAWASNGLAAMRFGPRARRLKIEIIAKEFRYSSIGMGDTIEVSWPGKRQSDMRVSRDPNRQKVTRFLFIFVLLAFLGALTLGQEKTQKPAPAPQQEPAAVLKITTRLVTVDVVARDHHGNPVLDLKASHFQISEQAGSRKSAQQVASFRLLDRALATAPDSEKAALRLPAGVYTNLVTTKNLSAPPAILSVDGLNTDAATQVQVRQKMQ